MQLGHNDCSHVWYYIVYVFFNRILLLNQREKQKRANERKVSQVVNSVSFRIEYGTIYFRIILHRLFFHDSERNDWKLCFCFPAVTLLNNIENSYIHTLTHYTYITYNRNAISPNFFNLFSYDNSVFVWNVDQKHWS